MSSAGMSCRRSIINEAIRGDTRMVIKLLRIGASPHITDEFGCTPVYYAARYDHIEVLNILHESGGCLETKNIFGRSPLQIAAYHGSYCSAEFIVNNNVKVNEPDELKNTALHWAAQNGHTKVVAMLLKAGADHSLTNKFGKTASELAFKNRHFTICSVIQNYLQGGSLLFMRDDREQTKFDQHPVYFEGTKEDDPVKAFEKFGIKLLPVDQSSIITSAVKGGKKVVLTEAGRLALKKTGPQFIRNIAGMSFRQPVADEQPKGTRPPPKKRKTSEPDFLSELFTTYDAPSESTGSIRLDAESFLDAEALLSEETLLSEESLLNKESLLNQEPLLIGDSLLDDLIRCSDTGPDDDVIDESKKTAEALSIIAEYQKEVATLKNTLKEKEKSESDIKKQLELALRVAHHYKSRCELKEKEAALYKSQLDSFTQILERSGLFIGDRSN